MSILANVFSAALIDNWNGIEDDETVPQNYWELARLGYDPHNVKSYREQIAQARSEDERILLAAGVAHSRCNGRHLGPPMSIEYSPQNDHGYDFPARSALTWLLEHGQKVGISLRLKE